MDRKQEGSARNIAAGDLRTFFTATLPLAMPGIVASAISVFLEYLDGSCRDPGAGPGQPRHHVRDFLPVLLHVGPTLLHRSSSRLRSSVGGSVRALSSFL